ncbi:MAG: hypothetical protein ABW043_07800 [Devosia sp.]|uniref:hypothetical protein n=1 Tax=Devosia sp. TaxID=1871048 RepID=UPI00339AF84B
MATASTMTGSTWGERLKLRVSTIVWFLLALAFVLGLPVLLDVHVLLLVAIAFLALLLAFPFAWFVRLIFGGQRRQPWGWSFAKAFLALVFAITTLIAAPLYFLAFRTELAPLTVPQATLSNGQKTVVFQGMMHIGSEGFYKSVIYDLEKALSEGYAIYYEGVRGDPAGDKWFADTLAGGGDLNTNYETFGDACGLQFQGPYFELLAGDMKARPERHVEADVSAADMMREYQRLMDTDPEFAAAVEKDQPAPPDSGEADQTTQMFGWLANATPGQRKILGLACRGWMTMLMGAKTAPSALDPVILDFRNQKLAERIVTSADDKIFITYGAGHLPGLLDDLQKSDPAWEIKSLKWMRTIETPEDLEGQI